MIRQPGADEQFREAAMHIAAFLLSGACPAQLALREVRYTPYARAGGASALEHSADRAGALARFPLIRAPGGLFEPEVRLCACRLCRQAWLLIGWSIVGAGLDGRVI